MEEEEIEQLNSDYNYIKYYVITRNVINCIVNTMRP